MSFEAHSATLSRAGAPTDTLVILPAYMRWGASADADYPLGMVVTCLGAPELRAH